MPTWIDAITTDGIDMPSTRLAMPTRMVENKPLEEPIGRSLSGKADEATDEKTRPANIQEKTSTNTSEDFQREKEPLSES